MEQQVSSISRESISREFSSFKDMQLEIIPFADNFYAILTPLVNVVGTDIVVLTTRDKAE